LGEEYAGLDCYHQVASNPSGGDTCT
jgi:hypothetical protein